MRYAVGAASAMFILLALVEGFETFVLPRRVVRRLRFARIYFHALWRAWSTLGRLLHDDFRRESFLAIYGPLSLLGLLGLFALGLIAGFAGLHWAFGSHVNVPGVFAAGFGSDLYFSGTTLFTLGLGDISPSTGLGRLLTVLESGFGLGFLALAVSYLPVLYQAFSRRETAISLLDARAGSPPHAAGLLAGCGGRGGVEQLLSDWELWSAELLESHLSYPVLAFYRSQHTNQSWLAATTAILDACAIVLASDEGELRVQARRTWRMSLHAIADLGEVLGADAASTRSDRLPPPMLDELRRRLPGQLTGENSAARLAQLRGEYEPTVQALSEMLLMALPPWFRSEPGA